VVSRSGSLQFRPARGTTGVMVIKALSMGLGFAVSVVAGIALGQALGNGITGN